VCNSTSPDARSAGLSRKSSRPCFGENRTGRPTPRTMRIVTSVFVPVLYGSSHADARCRSCLLRVPRSGCGSLSTGVHAQRRQRTVASERPSIDSRQGANWPEFPGAGQTQEGTSTTVFASSVDNCLSLNAEIGKILSWMRLRRIALPNRRLRRTGAAIDHHADTIDQADAAIRWMQARAMQLKRIVAAARHPESA
jgi:hypothetical protein